MSGGFLRGTSADQDTRFSNKQAKLLKSQKFAPELEHLVDMTKVKMDVMRPWIANRVTELIGFEDEVLINFIYGLLDGKEINGKEVQISLTGFMERNTGKFMKELWSLLLSAQKNASGVPQQFLNDKEEETKKKKAESDQIANEIQRRKEKESRELEQVRNEKMDRGYILKDVDSVVEPSSKHEQRPSVARSVEEKEPKDKNGARGRSRVSKSPHSINLSSSPRGRCSRSISKSVSNSRSYSGDRPRNLSASNKQRGRSGSSERIHCYSPQHFLTRRRGSPLRSYSPSRRSSYSKRRSSSRSHRRSPSPTYRMRRRSRSPFRRRSKSPIWRRPRSPTRRSSPWNGSRSPIQLPSSSVEKRSPSPIQRKSPSPLRQKYRGSRSAIRHRSRSPMQRRSRSPMQRRSRSPIWHWSQSPIQHRSRSPIRRRSRSPIRRRSRSPFRGRLRSPIRRRSSSPIRHKSPSPVWYESVPPSGSSSPRRSSRLVNHKSPSLLEWSSASPVQRRSPSLVGRRSPKRHRRSPLQSPRGRIRELERHTPVRDTVARNAVECLTDTRQRSNSLDRQSDSWDQNDSHRKLKRSLLSPRRSPSVSEAERETSLIEKSVKIHHVHSPNPSRKAREKRLHNGTSETSADDKEKFVGKSSKIRYNSSAKIPSPDQHKHSRIEDHEYVAPERFGVHHPVQAESRDGTELNKNKQVLQRGNKSEKLEHQTKSGQQDSQKSKDILPSEKKKESPIQVRDRAGEKNQSHLDDTKIRDRHLEDFPKFSGKVMRNDQNPLVSDLEESDKNRAEVKDKRKHKRSGRRELESDEESSYDSYAEERKEAKRRRKEEKKMRKEEKRWLREEKRRRKEERREGKQKLKSGDTVSTPSDTDGKHDDHFDDDRGVKRWEPGEGDMDEPLTEQKRLEIELREKAIELYMAKKGISH